MTQSVNNFEAADLLQQLYPHKHSKVTKKQRKRIVEEAAAIFNRIEGKKSVDVIHKLVRIYLHLGHSRRIDEIWNDIQALDKTKLEYSLLIKCLLESNNVKQCFQMLEWMESVNKYVLNIHDKLIAKLIAKCGADLKHVSLIHRLIKKGIIANNNTLIKTALINKYGQLNQMDVAINIFESIRDYEMDIVCIGSMMKLFVANNEYSKALQLYDNIESYGNSRLQRDDICDSIALTASTKLGKRLKSDAIREQMSLNSNNIKSKTALIDFHGDSGNIEEALNTFHSVAAEDQDAVIGFHWRYDEMFYQQ